ncbi:efflux RND transporter periplasmic adaptor subunit [Roseovarius autotrophicus]|uniref:efflux RND transporter periplasmic adaptor subunit n=1 Tax=Roseovarius autotrophicus TaxID=2824121 RepID=UPI0019EDA111|nr:HlyD family efflux transporter periplasmic adaptor subunit [Roseovarius autotrophicus]MBE0454320.1 HlyD family efflux transporter periplasmic adaptor subunit [Roseovarius sp.]
MRFLRQGLLGLFLLSVTLGLLAYAGQTLRLAIEDRINREARMPERRERVFAVRVVRPEAETVTPTMTAFGRIESRRTLEIRTQAAGVITELAPGFVEGGTVTAGQLLARIDPADAEAALARARTDLADARAEVREAERALALARDELAAREEQADIQTRALARQRDLESRGVGTLTAIEAAEYNLVQARQAVLSGRQALALAEARVDQAATASARADLALSEAERRLAETRITAGFSGRLSQVSVIEGRLVSANEQLARLVDGRALEVAFRVSNAQYAQLIDANGTLRPAPVTVALDSGDVRITATGRIAREAAALAEGESGRMIFAALDDAPAMKPGDFVTVTVEEPPLTDVARLPASALGSDGAVLALGADDRLERLPVTLLRRQGNDVLVRAADVTGREIVTERSPALGPGLKVRRLTPEAATSGADEDATSAAARRAPRMGG